ncbi:MAG: DNA-binding protein, partial [Romboutsia sp.]
LQNKEVSIEDIAKELGIVTKTLKSFLNKKGYKLENGKYVIKEDKKINQIEFNDISVKKDVNKREQISKSKSNSNNATIKKQSKISKDKNVLEKSLSTRKVQPKKDRKINITQEDIDKLCEVYDWYMEVKEIKAIKLKKNTNKKDIKIDKKDLKDLKTTSIKVDKKTWEDFERICSNSQFTKIEILTQALNDFMNEYKYLI